jgi:phage shock protein A
VRGSAFEAGQAVTDAKALTILDQQIRDAGAAQAKARDDMATLVATRRMIEKEIEALTRSGPSTNRRRARRWPRATWTWRGRSRSGCRRSRRK